MGKVTVKHYLNTNICVQKLNESDGKPLNDEILHPVYVHLLVKQLK